MSAEKKPAKAASPKKRRATPKRKASQKPLWQKKIARERVEILFDEAEKAVSNGNTKLADRYVEIARKIGMRYNVRLSRSQKRKFCKYCYSYMRPGITCSIRYDSKKKTIKVKCFKCNKIIHIPYK